MTHLRTRWSGDKSFRIMSIAPSSRLGRLLAAAQPCVQADFFATIAAVLRKQTGLRHRLHADLVDQYEESCLSAINAWRASVPAPLAAEHVARLGDLAQMPYSDAVAVLEAVAAMHQTLAAGTAR